MLYCIGMIVITIFSFLTGVSFGYGRGLEDGRTCAAIMMERWAKGEAK